MQVMVNLIYDPEYKGYVADVPSLPGCMSQGKTVQSALRNVREAIALYRETRPCAGNQVQAPIFLKEGGPMRSISLKIGD